METDDATTRVVPVPTSDPLVGRTVEGRYELTGTIDRGGMATVYVATDHRLDRSVAVKVMHASLAHDPDFVARFEREAKAAARINHPNVVAVTDTGVDGELVFLVMELVRGRTLRDLLRERRRLTAPQALEVLEPMLTALDAAARAGIVHRDVKPENVLLGDEGVVKVADFGLARAVEASGLTTHAGLLLGTVAYLPPEQVTNGRSDGRGDVYAAGVVLFEMLTGTVPYEAETPLAVAYRHVHETVPAPSTRVADVPPELDAVVARATAVDPADRYPDVAAFLAEVRRIRPTLAAPPRRRDTLALPLTEHLTAPMVRPTPGPPPPTSAPPTKPPKAKRTGRRRRWPYVVAALVLLSALAGGLGWWLGVDHGTRVPDLGDRSLAAYEQSLTAKGLHYVVAPAQPSDTVAKGLVLDVDPRAGAHVKARSTVTIVPSAGVQMVTVPTVTGVDAPTATSRLAAVGLAVGTTSQVYSDSAAAGTVVGSTPPAGSVVDHRTKVVLQVSQGPAPVTVQDETGKPADQATAAFQGVGLKVTTTQAFSDTVPNGSVISQTPPGGSAAHRGDTVALVVSKGPQMVTVPDLGGMSGPAAQAALRAVGLVPDEQDPFGPGGTVFAQRPEAGKKVKPGTTVTFATA